MAIAPGAFPAGRSRDGETLAEALVREVREEAGVVVEVGRMLYVCDHVGAHVVHITFEARRVGGRVGAGEPGKDSRPIRGVEFVTIADLPGRGFSERFVQLCQDGFPGAGSYMGPKSAIGLG
ncbi:NUDIX hydrolase [Fodinicola feengrottensis]|uniref:NUDIX hydrolase n=1 Tax=Fodinicola feengrottensis TaxID=435914 RepID=UPI002441382D|nr:NUDIX hydrolase [Fodinicola feengrottensis]